MWASDFVCQLCAAREVPNQTVHLFRVLSVFPTTWGIYSSLEEQPKRPFQIGF
jgi:hypothetical protein